MCFLNITTLRAGHNEEVRRPQRYRTRSRSQPLAGHPQARAAVAVTRTFKRIDFEIYAGGQEFINYSTAGISNTGITGFQPLATYTNITGGLGIFSSRSKYTRSNLILNDPALNLLKTSDLTKLLNFR